VFQSREPLIYIGYFLLQIRFPCWSVLAAERVVDVTFEIEQEADGPSAVAGSGKPRLLGILGPGLITGASDDDPSGIATYSQTGAQFGYALSWTMLFTYPLMTAVQMVSARMGRTTLPAIFVNIVLPGFSPPWWHCS
jgi:Natural resistance-associated macrophage protein-like